MSGFVLTPAPGELSLIPDAEKVVSDFLREDADVAAIVGRRIVGKTPNSISEPWIRLTQIGGPSDPTSTVDYLVGFLLQLDCYAGAEGGQPEANLLGRTVRAALRGIRDGTHEDAIATRAQINGDSRIPDTTIEPARERRILTVTVWLHPIL